MAERARHRQPPEGGHGPSGPVPPRRRALLMAALAAVLPDAARTASRPWRVGVLVPGPEKRPAGGVVDRFVQALRAEGLEPGRDVELAWRFDEHDPQRTLAQARELVQWPADLIVAGTSPAARVLKGLTTALPVVMAVSGDPVADGLVQSLARPGGNVTGLSIMTPEINARRVQLLHDAVPGLQRLTLLAQDGPLRRTSDVDEARAAAQALGIALQPRLVAGLDEVDAALGAARREGAQALMLGQSPLFAMRADRLAALALTHRLPSIAGSGEFDYASAGGLMNFGPDLLGAWQRSAHYVRRILVEGQRPAELPVQQPQRVRLVINLATAETLGLTLQRELLLRADALVR